MANDIVITKNDTAGLWDVTYTVDKSGSVSKTMDTSSKFLDRDIKVAITTPAGSHEVTATATAGGSVVTAPAVTPKTTITSTVSGKTESSYGITTTQPTGTGAKYVTFDPNGDPSNGKVTATAEAVGSCTATAGYIAGGTDTDSANATKDITVTPTVNAGTNKYVNVFETGDATVTAVLDPQTSPTTDVTVTVTVPKGLTEGFTKTAKFDILGSLDVPGASADVRTGKKFYDAQGGVVIGTMGNAETNLNGPEFSGGAASSTTTITAVTTAPTRPSTAGDKGAAVNYAESTGLTNYVTIGATGTGGAAAVGVSGSVDCVTAGYMATGTLETISGTKAAVSKSSSDTNFIKASTDSSITANAATISGSTSATATATATATASGSVTTGESYFLASGTNSYKVVFEADAEAVAKADATSNGSASATAGADKTLSVKDTYMLNNVAVKSAAIGSTALTGGSATDTKSANDSKELTKYIKAGSATPSATVAGTSTALTSPSAMDYQYFTVDPKATVGAAGWIASISNGTQLKYKVKDGAYSCSTEGTITANATASTNMTTISKPSSGTEGTDYFSITATPSATGTINGYAEITTAGWLPTGHIAGTSKSGATGSADKKYIAKAVLGTSGSVTVSGSGTVTPDAVSIGDQDASVTGKIRIALTPSTATTSISKYYVAVAGTSAAKSSAGTISVSGTGTASASVSTAGYAPTTLTGSGSVSGSGSATVNLGAKTGSVYYAPIATIGLKASGSASGSTTVTPSSVSIADQDAAVSGKTRITVTPSTGTSSISTYYIAVAGTSASGSGSAALSGTATASVNTTGYGTAGVETGTGSVSGTATVTLNSKTGSVYYCPIATLTFGTPGNKNSAGYLGASVYTYNGEVA